MNEMLSSEAVHVINKHCANGQLKEPIVLSHPDIECGVIITPSAKVPDTFQASYFNAKSWMLIDNTFTDLESAVGTVVDMQGYTADGLELFERLAQHHARVIH